MRTGKGKRKRRRKGPQPLDARSERRAPAFHTRDVIDRVCSALHYSPVSLSRALGCTLEEIRDLRDSQESVESNPLWWALNKFLDERIGLLLAARADVQSILQHARKQRIMACG